MGSCMTPMCPTALAGLSLTRPTFNSHRSLSICYLSVPIPPLCAPCFTKPFTSIKTPYQRTSVNCFGDFCMTLQGVFGGLKGKAEGYLDHNQARLSVSQIFLAIFYSKWGMGSSHSKGNSRTHFFLFCYL